MDRRIAKTAAFVAAVAVAVACSPALAVAVDRPAKPLAAVDGAQRTPDLSSRYAVWEDERLGDDQLWVYDLGTGSSYQLTSGSSKKSHPTIDGTRVVAEDSRTGVTSSLYQWDAVSGAEAALASSSIFDRYLPSISGTWTSWVDVRNGNYDIFAYNSATDTTIAVETDGYRQDEPAMSGNRIVWTDTRLSAGSWGDIWAYNVSGGIKGPICTDSSIQLNPSVSGNRAVWQDYRNDNYDIYAYDFATGLESVVCTESHTQANPRISGNWVVWQDDRNGDWDIYAKNLQTGAEIPVCTAAGNQTLPRASGNWVVWQDERADTGDIWAATLSAAPDLAAVSATAQALGVPSASYAVNVSVRNSGDAASGSTPIGIYFSTDATIDRSDTRVGTADLGWTGPGATATQVVTFLLPNTVAFGHYYVGVIADADGAVNEMDESDNTAAAGAVDVVATTHDMFSAATPIAGGSGSVTGDSNVGAGKESGEPNHAGKPGGASIWYRWTAPTSGWVSMNTYGSGIDTVLGVYTGWAPGALGYVASNDDSGGLQSALRFYAYAGGTYSIAVDGVAGAQGPVQLAWRMDDKLAVSVPRYVRKYRTFYVRGSLWPGQPAGSKVTVQVLRKSGTRWVNYRKYVVGVTSSNTYAARIKLGGGTWKIRAYHSDYGYPTVYTSMKYCTAR